MDSYNTVNKFETSPVQEMIKYTAILEEMGFGTVDSKTINRKLSRKSSIGLSNFWSTSEKERFLREKGYQQAYKNLQKHEMMELESRKIAKHASLPRIMDINTVAKVRSLTKSLEKPKRFLKFKSTSLMESPIKMKFNKNHKIIAIDTVMDKCNSLINDMDTIRKSALDLKKLIHKNFGLNNERRKRISSFDLLKIKSDISKIK